MRKQEKYEKAAKTPDVTLCRKLQSFSMPASRPLVTHEQSLFDFTLNIDCASLLCQNVFKLQYWSQNLCPLIWAGSGQIRPHPLLAGLLYLILSLPQMPHLRYATSPDAF